MYKNKSLSSWWILLLLSKMYTFVILNRFNEFFFFTLKEEMIPYKNETGSEIGYWQ